MRNIPFKLVLAAALLAGILSFVVREPHAAAEARSRANDKKLKLALLVGVGEYNDSSWPGLSGPENDVTLLKELLEDARFGFQEVTDPKKKERCGNQRPESGILTLCSEQATRAAILNAFDDHLIKRARKHAEENALSPSDGATIVFYYSGHGFYLKDKNGDEPDGYDETIVPYDAVGTEEGQITDDELKLRLDELKKYTTNITFISDSCHSGSITRGDPSRGGGNALKGTTGIGSALSDGVDVSDDYVTISASLPNQFAREFYYPDPETGEERAHGALTFNLVALVDRYPGASYRELLQLLRNALNAQGAGQTPMAEGAIDRIVFGSESAHRITPIFPVCDSEEGRISCARSLNDTSPGKKDLEVRYEVTLPVGEIVGAMEGGPVAVYAPGTRELTGSSGLIGSGTIISADPVRSKAVVSGSKDKLRSIPQNAQFVLVSPFFATEKKLVAIDKPSGVIRGASQGGALGILDQIAKKLEDNRYVKPVRGSQILSDILESERNGSSSTTRSIGWTVAVVSSSYRDFLRLAGGQEEEGALQREVLYLIDRNGVPMYHFSVFADGASAVSEVIRALELHTRIANIGSLSNKASNLTGKVFLKYVPVEHIGPPGSKNECEVRLKRTEARSTSNPNLRIGDKFYFEIVNASSKPLFIYMYSIAADGSITYFYPGAGAHEELPVGAVFRTFETDCFPFEVIEGSKTGPESVKIIATTSPIQAEILESPSIGRNRRGVQSPLEDLLNRAATNTRGSGSVSVDDWTTMSFDYVVVR